MPGLIFFFMAHSRRAKVEMKVKIFFDVCHIFIDPFAFASAFALWEQALTRKFEIVM